MNEAQILKLSKEGKCLMQVGHYGKNGRRNDLENFGRAARISVDPKRARPDRRRSK